METNIPLIGVLLATISSFVVGSIWYSPSVFLKPWMNITGATEAHMKEKFVSSMIYIGIASLVTAYTLAHFILYSEHFTGTSGVSAGLQTAFWTWLGLVVTTIVANGALEPRNPVVMVIYAGNRLVTLLLMGAILGAFM